MAGGIALMAGGLTIFGLGQVPRASAADDVASIVIADGFPADQALAGQYLVAVGATVTVPYAVTNTGNVGLYDIEVTSALGTAVTCPQSALDVGATMICTAQPRQVTAADLGSMDRSGAVTAHADVASGEGSAEADENSQSDGGAQGGGSADDGEGAPGQDAQAGGGADLAGGDAGAQAEGTGDTAAQQPTDPALVQVTATAETGPLTGFTVVEQLTSALTITEVPAPTGAAAPGQTLLVGSDVSAAYQVSNTGQTALASVTVTSQLGAEVSCPATALELGATMVCLSAPHTVTVGDTFLEHGASAVATGPTGEASATTDPSDPWIVAEAMPDASTPDAAGADIAGAGNPDGTGAGTPDVADGSTPDAAGAGTPDVADGKAAGANGADADAAGAGTPDGVSGGTPDVTGADAAGTETAGAGAPAGADTGTPDANDTGVGGAGRSDADSADNSETSDTDNQGAGETANPDTAANQGTAGVGLLPSMTWPDANHDGMIQVGEPVTLTYTVTNTGDGPLDQVQVHSQLADADGVQITCPAPSLAPGESMVCTRPDRTTTAADAAAGSVADLATASALNGAEAASSEQVGMGTQVGAVASLPRPDSADATSAGANVVGLPQSLPDAATQAALAASSAALNAVAAPAGSGQDDGPSSGTSATSLGCMLSGLGLVTVSRRQLRG